MSLEEIRITRVTKGNPLSRFDFEDKAIENIPVQDKVRVDVKIQLSN